MKVTEQASVSFKCFFSGSTVQLSRADRRRSEAPYVCTGPSSFTYRTKLLCKQITFKLSGWNRSTITLDELRDEEKRLLSLSPSIFLSSERVLIATTGRFYFLIGDIMSCYLREEEKEWLHVLMQSGAVRKLGAVLCYGRRRSEKKDWKIAGEERERGRSGGKESKSTFFVSLKTKSDIDEKTWRGEGKREIRRKKMWWLLCNWLAATHTLTLASFAITWTGQNYSQRGKTLYVLELLRSDGLKTDVFIGLYSK